MQHLDDRYQKDITKAYAHLSAEEELDLIIKAQSGCTRSQNKLVDGQLYQIIRIAKMYLKSNHRNEMSDLIGVGIAGHYNQKGVYSNGFIRAIHDFDVTSGVRLITFALNYIRNGIRDYSQDNDLVRNTRQKSKSRANDPIHMADLEYEAGLRGMSVDTYIESQKAKGNDISKRTKAEKFGIMSFDAPLGSEDNESVTLMDIFADAGAQTDSGTVSSDIKRMISILNKDELEHVDQFFGLTGDKMTLDEIGKLNGGISRQAVSNRLSKSLDKMRTSFNCISERNPLNL
jgi:RNA polymerase sigma factor (sigma-70 family)